MAYYTDFPADDSYLADFPSGEREQIRAIVEDKIVNAGKLQGLAPSNASGQVPVSNGTVCNNLNADKLDGYDASHFSKDGHVHNNASTSTAGFMSAADKTKLDGVATGAEVNQNAFGNVSVGSTTLQADNKQDTLYIAAGNNISIAADETNDKITIGLTGIVPVANGGTGKSDLDNVNVGGAGTLNSWKYRPTTANNTFADAKVRYYLATSSMTTAKPPSDGAILHLPGDNSLFDMQLHISNSDAAVSVRAQNGSDDWSGSTGWKKLAFAADVQTAITNAINSAVTSVTKTLSDNMHAQYPVGSYIYSDKADNPATYLPYMSDTTWIQTAAGRVLIGAGTADSGTVYTAGQTGGEEKHTLTTSEMPSHSHGRGTMNIAGTVCSAYGETKTTTSGAFTWENTGGRQDGGDGHDGEPILTSTISFDASKNWTGQTSTVGDGVSHNNLQPYEVVYLWKRTS